jgi:hypothetical protein
METTSSIILDDATVTHTWRAHLEHARYQVLQTCLRKRQRLHRAGLLSSAAVGRLRCRPAIRGKKTPGTAGGRRCNGSG